MDWNKVAYLMEVVFQEVGLVVQVFLCLGRLYLVLEVAFVL